MLAYQRKIKLKQRLELNSDSEESMATDSNYSSDSDFVF